MYKKYLPVIRKIVSGRIVAKDKNFVGRGCKSWKRGWSSIMGAGPGLTGQTMMYYAGWGGDLILLAEYFRICGVDKGRK